MIGDIIFEKRLPGVFFDILIHVSVIVKMQHISLNNANTLFGNKQCKNILMKLYLKQLIKFTRNCGRLKVNHIM